MINPVILNCHVMVVDDDAMVRSIIIEYLQSFGFKRIAEFKDGAAAVRYLNDAKNIVHLVISDWEMPQVNGLTLLKAVRNHPKRRSIKFIMVTSQSSGEKFKVAQAAQYGVDAYIVKPFRGNVLQEKIMHVIGNEVFTENEGE